MEQKMNSIDLDYWMKGVELGQIRGRLIRELLDLMDFEYQKRAWIKEGDDTSFDDDISFAREMFFDELSLDDYLKKKEPPYNGIDVILKSRKEAEALYAVVEILHPMNRLYSRNSEYLSSPHLPKLHKAAREAFEAFMENEKDNKEFCDFINECEVRHKKEIEVIDAGRKVVNDYTNDMLQERYDHYVELHNEAICVLNERAKYHEEQGNGKELIAIKKGIESLERDLKKISSQGLEYIKNIICRGPSGLRRCIQGYEGKAYYFQDTSYYGDSSAIVYNVIKKIDDYYLEM